MALSPLTVAWISDFGLEWLPDLPEPLRALPRQHPLSWQRVLFSELVSNQSIHLHVIVLRKNIPSNVSFERDGARFHVLKSPGGFRAPSFFWVDTLLIKSVLKQIKPDLVHAWGTERGAALVASRLGYPYVVSMQGLISWLRQLAPLNIHNHFAAFLEQFCLPRAPVITAESKFAVNFLHQRFPRPQILQVEHAPNWLFHQVQRRPQTNPLRFIFVGTLSPLKGTDLLLRTLDNLRTQFPFELILVGSPSRKDYLAHLKSITSPELWRRVRHYEALTPEQLAEQLAVATMMLFPTRGDTSPNAVKEAVVAGLPVVASALSGIPEYIFSAENGLLFPANDIAEFTRAIEAASQHPLFSRGLVEARSLVKTRDYLSPKRMGHRFEEVYRNLFQNCESTLTKRTPNQRIAT